MFEGIDLLDATKLVPEELAPVEIIGRLTLNRNPTNYFSETEQVAFCTAHVPRGIDFTDDPLLQARNFSYLDTQLTRLGGPNFDQLPINRAHSPVNTTQRDGFGQQAVPEGTAPYNPNSLGGGCPFPAGTRGVRPRARRKVSGERVQSSGRVVLRPLLPGHPVLGEHERTGAGAHRGGVLVRAGKVPQRRDPRPHAGQSWPTSTPTLTSRVAASLGKTAAQRQAGPELRAVAGPVAAPRRAGPDRRSGGRHLRRRRGRCLRSRLGEPSTRASWCVGRGHRLPRWIHPGEDGSSIEVTKSALTTQSVEYDAVVVAGGAGAHQLARDPYLAVNLGEAFRHYKTVGAWGDGVDVLGSCSVASDAPGVVTAPRTGRAFSNALIEAIGWHRHWDRPTNPVSGE